MKKTITAILSLALLTCLIIYSCQKEGAKPFQSDTAESQSPLALSKGASSSVKKTGWQPAGSTLSPSNGGYLVSPAPGWYYTGYDAETKETFSITDRTYKTISCTCNNKSGECRPFEASGPKGTISGCGGDCTDCTMKQSTKVKDKNIDILSGGYYMPSAQTRLIKNGEAIPAVFDALLELGAFKDAFNKFLMEAYQNQPVQSPVKDVDGSMIAPKGYSLVGVSIMGRGLVTIVPDKFAFKYLGYTTSAKATCNCSEGSCELKNWKLFGLGTIFCEGLCTTCTLTTSDLKQNDRLGYSISLPSYKL
nr:hypothetical protein [Pedobacter sp. ASV19]